MLGGRNLTESNEPLSVYYSKKRPSIKHEELNLNDFALFTEDSAEQTFSANKKPRNAHMFREDITPGAGNSGEKQPKSSNFNGLSSLSKIDM